MTYAVVKIIVPTILLGISPINLIIGLISLAPIFILL